MATQNSERLRQLVGDYYHGLITPDSYREQRAELLDNIGADIDEPSTAITERQQPSKEEEPTTPTPADANISRSSFKPIRWAMGAIGLAAVAAGAYMVLIQGVGSGWIPGSTSVQEGVVEESGPDFGGALVEEFLDRNDWMADSLNNFLIAWGALDDGQRQRATEGRLYRRLRTALHQRIREEVALGRAPGDERLDSLMSFAKAMGSPYRESRAFNVEQKTVTEVPVTVDVPDEPDVISAESDLTAVESTDPEAAAAETAGPAVTPIVESGRPVDDLVPEPSETGEPIDDPCPFDLANSRQPYCRDVLADGGMGPRLVVLPTGSYEMGSDSAESESPPHDVEISYHIALSRYEITALEYEQFCAATSLPCEDQSWGDEFPVVSVSWDDATLYAEWLSDTTGFRYRLPSEAEWEFAARAGTQSPYFFGDEITPSAAHSSENGAADSPFSRTDRNINRNPFRLYHMSGNVREWTQDTWSPNYDSAPVDGSARVLEAESLRTVRGGSYSDPGIKLRSAAREPLERDHRDDVTGFRIVREVIEQADK